MMMHTEMGGRNHDIDVDDDDEDDVDLDDSFESLDSDDDDTDNIGDVSVEINVESLIAEIEEAHDSDAARKREVHRRLEEIREHREVSKEMEDTFAAYLDDED